MSAKIQEPKGAKTMPSDKSAIRRAALKILENKDAKIAETLKACGILLRQMALATKGKPRGKPFAKKADKKPRNDLSTLLERIQ